MPTAREQFEAALEVHSADFQIQLGTDELTRLGQYYELLLKWNERLHLVASCSPEEFAIRHALESLFALRHIDRDARIVEVGAGAGLPSIPCLIARPDVRGILIESSSRKAVFLREALRRLGLAERAEVIAARFQETETPTADVLMCRAIERFPEVLPELIRWAPANATLLFFGGELLREKIEKLLPSALIYRVPKSERRFLIKASPS